jgi:hypothetical protein
MAENSIPIAISIPISIAILICTGTGISLRKNIFAVAYLVVDGCPKICHKLAKNKYYGMLCGCTA